MGTGASASPPSAPASIRATSLCKLLSVGVAPRFAPVGAAPALSKRGLADELTSRTRAIGTLPLASGCDCGRLRLLLEGSSFSPRFVAGTPLSGPSVIAASGRELTGRALVGLELEGSELVGLELVGLELEGSELVGLGLVGWELAWSSATAAAGWVCTGSAAGPASPLVHFGPNRCSPAWRTASRQSARLSPDNFAVNPGGAD